MLGRRKQQIPITPFSFDFSCTGDPGGKKKNLMLAGVSLSPPERLAGLGLSLFTTSAHLSLLSCSHDTLVFPPEVGVNGLL